MYLPLKSNMCCVAIHSTTIQNDKIIDKGAIITGGLMCYTWCFYKRTHKHFPECQKLIGLHTEWSAEIEHLMRITTKDIDVIQHHPTSIHVLTLRSHGLLQG